MSHRVSAEFAGRSRKGRALLAGGAVLGLGAVATLAAWSDDVWVVSSFTTTPFSIEAAVAPKAGFGWENPDWQEFSTPNGGKLQFQVLSTEGMLPGDAVYAPLNLMVTTGSGATVSLKSSPIGPGGNGFNAAFFNALDLTLYAVPPNSCNASGTSEDALISGFNGAALDDSELIGSDLVTLPTANVPQGICFKITLPSDVGPEVRTGKTEALVWSLHATPL